MRELKNTKIIAVDHGYGNMKTANTVTPTGIKAYETEPIFTGIPTPARPMGGPLPLPDLRTGQRAVPTGERGWHRRTGCFADRHQYRCHDRRMVSAMK